MKKVLFQILLTIFLTDNTSLDQFFKVGFIFQHYSEHQQQDKTLSMMGFLSMHYWGQDLPDHDDEKDNQLPFKKMVINLHYDFCSPFRTIELNTPVTDGGISYALPKNYGLPEAYLHALFKPPRPHSLS